MKNWMLAVLCLAGLFLIVLSLSTPEEPSYSNTAAVTTDIPDLCRGTQELGARCATDCECLRPLECRNDRCLVPKRLPTHDCVSNDDCTTNYCIGGKCEVPTSFGGKTCKVVCRQEIKQERKCYTVCSEHGSDTTQYDRLP